MTTKLLAKDGEGERLDRFELIAELASGGMATVFLARLSGVAGFQRLVAIKRLHPHLAREPEFVEMFLDEARLAARIHHPNVVPIQEVGESDRGYYLVMDYIEGDTLARVLGKANKAQAVVPYGVTIRILLDVLAGLHAAHTMKDDHGQLLGIVHRDVSPQNILIGVDGVARVVDFGVARATSRLSTTRSGQLKGKLAYMAPEQARGAGIDCRADLFSCGIVLWEALATKRLFKGDAEAETLNRVLYDPILPPSSVQPGVPPALEALCMKALERDVEKRFTSAAEFGEELEKAARALSCVGSVRDVTECLEAVMGADLTEQREAVRAWLARSEPSHVSTTRPRPVLDSIVTKVDGGARSVPAESSGSLPSAAAAEKISSVSSAAIHLPPPAPRRSRVTTSLFMLGMAILLLAAGAWGANQVRARSTSQSPVVANVEPVAATVSAPPPVAISVTPAAVVAVETDAAVSGSPSSEIAARPSASAPANANGNGSKIRLWPRPPATSRPQALPPAPTASGLPDDLSHNPYR